MKQKLQHGNNEASSDTMSSEEKLVNLVKM